MSGSFVRLVPVPANKFLVWFGLTDGCCVLGSSRRTTSSLCSMLCSMLYLYALCSPLFTLHSSLFTLHSSLFTLCSSNSRADEKLEICRFGGRRKVDLLVEALRSFDLTRWTLGKVAVGFLWGSASVAFQKLLLSRLLVSSSPRLLPCLPAIG